MAEAPPIPWGAWIELGEMAYDLMAQIFGLPDPLDLFISLFDGRPTLQATADIASLLNKYTSPTIKFLALGAAASLNAGVPLSASSGDPIFGPYFGAALGVENALRWGNQNPQAINLDDTTLTTALHEGGNPGQSGTPTLDAIQQTYEQFLSGQPKPGDATYLEIERLSQLPETDATTLMIVGWSSATISAGLVPGAAPGHPAPQTPSGPPQPVQAPTCDNPCEIALIEAANRAGDILGDINGVTYQQVEMVAALASYTFNLNQTTHLVRRELAHIRKKMPASTWADNLIAAVECICNALTNLAGSTGGSVDLNPIVQALNDLTAQVAAIAKDADTAAANDAAAGARLLAAVDYLNQNALMDSGIAQILMSQ